MLLLNVTLGVVLGDLFLDGDIKTNVFQRIIIGLSVSGLFDHTKIMKRMFMLNEKDNKTYYLALYDSSAC